MLEAKILITNLMIEVECIHIIKYGGWQSKIKVKVGEGR
jgi:hypothetical protein